MQNRRRSDAPPSNNDSAGGLDLPQGFIDERPSKVKVEERQDPRRRRRRDRGDDSNDGNSNWMWTFGLLVVIVLVASYFLIVEHEKVQMKKFEEHVLHDQVEPLSKEWEDKYSKIEDENKRLQQEAKDFDLMKKENERILENESHNNKLRQNEEKQIAYYQDYQNSIHERIQLQSHTLLLEKFGPGPHKVEISVAFDPEFPKKEDADSSEQKIIIEMAPVDEMPHVVYWFLEQVTRGLYDGCSFHRNAGHVVQGGPAPNFLSPPEPKLFKRFKDAGFNSVLFQEYSPKFPHEKYTLGLAGRPGGPDFYVSTRNNTSLHGPGGQSSYEDPTEADPCFAKVIEGFEVVDRMQLSPLKPGGYKAMTNNVAIVAMKLLKDQS